MLLTEPIEALLRAKKQRSTNVVVEDAVNLLHWINKKMMSRAYHDSLHLTIIDRQTSVALGISERRAKAAKSLLKEVKAIKFWRTIRTEDGVFVNLWYISVFRSRVVRVSNGHHKMGKDKRYRSSGRAATFEFVAEESNILTVIQDDFSSGSIFRKHRKIFERERLEALEVTKTPQSQLRNSIVRTKEAVLDFVDEYFSSSDMAIIDF
jgi:hypothetical protein